MFLGNWGPRNFLSPGKAFSMEYIVIAAAISHDIGGSAAADGEVAAGTLPVRLAATLTI